MAVLTTNRCPSRFRPIGCPAPGQEAQYSWETATEQAANESAPKRPGYWGQTLSSVQGDTTTHRGSHESKQTNEHDENKIQVMTLLHI
jgi:hypothetical protein